MLLKHDGGSLGGEDLVIRRVSLGVDDREVHRVSGRCRVAGVGFGDGGTAGKRQGCEEREELFRFHEMNELYRAWISLAHIRHQMSGSSPGGGA